jgi:heat shock protein HtpX
MILGSMVVAWFSRYREYRADAGGAKLSGKQNMINALQALRRMHELNNSLPETAPAMQSMKIDGRNKFLALFASHPPLEERIARLQQSF